MIDADFGIAKNQKQHMANFVVQTGNILEPSGTCVVAGVPVDILGWCPPHSFVEMGVYFRLAILMGTTMIIGWNCWYHSLTQKHSKAVRLTMAFGYPLTSETAAPVFVSRIWMRWFVVLFHFPVGESTILGNICAMVKDPHCGMNVHSPYIIFLAVYIHV